MKTLEQADVIWDFWDGHSAEDRNITTTLVSKSTSAMFFACTNARGESIEGVRHDLNKHSGSAVWSLQHSFSAMAQGGNMQRQIWVFSRCIEDCRQECKK